MPSTPRIRLTGALTATLLLTLAAAAPLPALAATGAPAARGTEALQVEQAWIRWLPADLPAGGFLTVTNHADRPVVLVGASSPDYANVDLHRSVIKDGLSTMEPVKQIVVAPHSTLSFSGTGYHLMLMRPTRPLSPGARVPITLHFSDGRSLLVNFAVRPPNATAPPLPATPGTSAKPR